MSFTTREIEVGEVNKYQGKGIAEKCQVTEVVLNYNEQYNSYSLSLKTVNENGQEGKSKRMSLKTDISEGKKVSAWTVTAKSLIGILMSIGNSRDQADNILEASDEKDLANRLSKALIGKTFRALFSSKEYEPGKFAIELYSTEPVGGTRLFWSDENPYYNIKLEKADNVAPGPGGLPF